MLRDRSRAWWYLYVVGEKMPTNNRKSVRQSDGGNQGRLQRLIGRRTILEQTLICRDREWQDMTASYCQGMIVMAE